MESPAAMVVFDRESRELCTVAGYFAARSAAVLDIQYADGLEGRAVDEGAPLAEIYWSDGTQEVLVAPAGCAGTVIWANRRIDYDRLHEPPAQVLIRLG
jgi:hypothetical protein